MSNVPIMVTLKEASTASGLSYDALRKLCIQGKIVHVRIGTKYFVNWSKLVEFLNGGEEESV